MNICTTCGVEFKPHRDSLGLYCSNVCQQRKQYLNYIERWLLGLEVGWTGKTRQLSGHVRKYLHESRGTACESCGWNMVHPVDGRVLTEVDHIDGDAENCRPDNLRILCPNCHAMTPTFRSRNKRSKRKRNAEVA